MCGHRAPLCGHRVHLHGSRSRRLPIHVSALTSVGVCVLVSLPTFQRCFSSVKMVRSRSAMGKRKANSPPDVETADVDAAAMRQHQRAGGERGSKARESSRRVHMGKSRELSRHGSPLPKRSRVIQVSTSEEAAEESEHSRGHSDRERSWRYVALSPLFSLRCLCTCLRRHC